MKLRDIEVEVITAANAGALETALVEFFDGTGAYASASRERTFISITRVADLTVAILYTQ